MMHLRINQIFKLLYHRLLIPISIDTKIVKKSAWNTGIIVQNKVARFLWTTV